MKGNIDFNRFKNIAIPTSISILLLFLTAIFWYGLVKRENEQFMQTLQSQAVTISESVSADLRHRLPSIERIAERWEIRGGTPKNEFEADASAIIEDLPGIQALEWVDENYTVQWIIPLEGNEQAQGLNLAFEEKRRTALEEAKNSNTPTMTGAIDLVQGGKGFLIYFPIVKSNEFEGFILAVFQMENWITYVLKERMQWNETKHFAFEISYDGTPVYMSQKDFPGGEKLAISSELQILNHDFLVKIIPDNRFLENEAYLIPSLSATFGGILSLFIGIIVFLYRKSSQEVRKEHLLSVSLKEESRRTRWAIAELQRVSERLELAVSAGDIGIWTWDLDTDSLDWNAILYEIYGLPTNCGPTYQLWRNAVHPEDLEDTEKKLQITINGGPHFSTDFRILRPTGEIRHIRAAALIEYDEDSNPVSMTGINWDITEIKTNEEKIRFMATHDTLTGLPSLRLARDKLDEGLGQAKRHGERIALMFVDLDGFKNVNDTYGHDTGDCLLKETANRLEKCLRETDTVARIGGDEFLVITTGIEGREDAELIAKKAVEALSKPFNLQNESIRVSASIGIALFPDNGKNAEELIKKADGAMYSIKKGGKNGFAVSL